MRIGPALTLFDLRRDPHEINNLADDPAYATIKAELLTALDNWRKNVIHDQGVTMEFRASGVFPEACPVPCMDDWVEANAENFDFNTHGWPAWYPTRTLAEWEKARKLWEPYVLRGSTEQVVRPQISHSNKKPPKKKPVK